jgi:hypothetical protein
MDKLPQEILIWIVSYLSTNDKLKCILVCRKWHDWISSNNLYQELTFVNNCGKSAKALELFEKRPEIAFNISKLRLEKCKLKPSFALKLPSLFPRLKQLIWYDNSEAIQHEEESKNWKFFQQQQQQKYEEALERWSKTLEEMKWDFMVYSMRISF